MQTQTKATFTSNVPAWKRDHKKAIDEALAVAAERYRSAVETRLSMGYKSGAFKTGKVAGSVKVTEPTTVKGARVIRVGTSVFYARMWEFGHTNKWTRLWERVPIWRPIAVSQGQTLGAQMLTSYGAMMSVWKPRGGKGASRKGGKS